MENDDDIWQPVHGALRVQRRHVWDSDEHGHFNYVLQQRWVRGAEGEEQNEWRDVPLVDEDGKPTKYR